MSATAASTAIWTMHAERWRKSIKAKSLSAVTERSYLLTAQRWITWLDAQGLGLEPAEVRAHHVDDFIADFIAATSPANGAHHYRNLRVFFGWLVKRREMHLNPMDQTDAPRVPEKITPLLTDEEHLRVLRACSGRDFASLRDTAIILLFIDTGLRVSELAGLTVDGIDLLARHHVRGKGGKVRLVGFGNAAGLAVAKYLKARAKGDVGIPACSQPKPGIPRHRHPPESPMARRGRPPTAHRTAHSTSMRLRVRRYRNVAATRDIRVTPGSVVLELGVRSTPYYDG
jgi:site-specific recombinase XerC